MGLTSIEYEIMSYFWEREEPIYFSEILSYFNDVKKKNWAKTTLHTYLTTLIRKGLLSSDKAEYKHSYTAAITKEELARIVSHKFIDRSFNSSLKSFLISFTESTPLTPEEIEELHQILDSMLPSGREKTDSD